MTNEQLYTAIGVPLLVNGLMFLALNWRIGDLKDSINKRFDDIKETWRAELRVEEVLDARLKHLEEKTH